MKKQIQGLEEQTRKHRAKIDAEKKKLHADNGLIRFWEREIGNHGRQLEWKRRRLRGDW